jgi:hypothetical protein
MRTNSQEADPEHGGKAPGGLSLGEVEEIRDKSDHVAALVAGGEVGPLAAMQINLERAGISACTARSAHHPIRTLPAAIGQPALEKGRQCRQGSAADPVDAE